MPNTKCWTTVKHTDEKSLKRENTKEQSESVAVPEKYIEACIRNRNFKIKMEHHFRQTNKKGSQIIHYEMCPCIIYVEGYALWIYS